MNRPELRKASKRVTCSKRYKIQKKLEELKEKNKLAKQQMQAEKSEREKEAGKSGDAEPKAKKAKKQEVKVKPRKKVATGNDKSSKKFRCCELNKLAVVDDLSEDETETQRSEAPQHEKMSSEPAKVNVLPVPVNIDVSSAQHDAYDFNTDFVQDAAPSNCKPVTVKSRLPVEQGECSDFREPFQSTAVAGDNRRNDLQMNEALNKGVLSSTSMNEINPQESLESVSNNSEVLASSSSSNPVATVFPDQQMNYDHENAIIVSSPIADLTYFIGEEDHDFQPSTDGTANDPANWSETEEAVISLLPEDRSYSTEHGANNGAITVTATALPPNTEVVSNYVPNSSQRRANSLNRDGVPYSTIAFTRAHVHRTATPGDNLLRPTVLKRGVDLILTYAEILDFYMSKELSKGPQDHSLETRHGHIPQAIYEANTFLNYICGPAEATVLCHMVDITRAHRQLPHPEEAEKLTQKMMEHGKQVWELSKRSPATRSQGINLTMFQTFPDMSQDLYISTKCLVKLSDMHLDLTKSLCLPALAKMFKLSLYDCVPDHTNLQPFLARKLLHCFMTAPCSERNATLLFQSIDTLLTTQAKAVFNWNYEKQPLTVAWGRMRRTLTKHLRTERDFRDWVDYIMGPTIIYNSETQTYTMIKSRKYAHLVVNWTNVLNQDLVPISLQFMELFRIMTLLNILMKTCAPDAWWVPNQTCSVPNQACSFYRSLERYREDCRLAMTTSNPSQNDRSGRYDDHRSGPRPGLSARHVEEHQPVHRPATSNRSQNYRSSGSARYAQGGTYNQNHWLGGQRRLRSRRSVSVNWAKRKAYRPY